MPSGTNRADIKPGMQVRVVQKQDQRTGKLTAGVVERLLREAAARMVLITVSVSDSTVLPLDLERVPPAMLRAGWMTRREPPALESYLSPRPVLKEHSVENRRSCTWNTRRTARGEVNGVQILQIHFCAQETEEYGNRLRIACPGFGTGSRG
jgi:uncharacterized repeat protein (TIGR03833 family)